MAPAARLALEADDHVAVLRGVCAEDHFHRHEPARLRVARPVHRAHSALTEQRDHLVAIVDERSDHGITCRPWPSRSASAPPRRPGTRTWRSRTPAAAARSRRPPGTGFAPFETQIAVAGAQTTAVDVKLAPLMRGGRLRVSEQSGKSVTVLIDNVAVGVTPCRTRR
ncbi:MAG: hypothetical protein IT374_21875 [Polyangiaceae bacterium]|nr:hypothetical protein [Polyangiaceae bacterium]